jgi:hypothetical protein
MCAKTAWVLVTCGDEDLLSLAELVLRQPAARVYGNQQA